MKVEDIQNIDIRFSFFHYTNKNNIESIAKNGLLELNPISLCPRNGVHK